MKPFRLLCWLPTLLLLLGLNQPTMAVSGPVRPEGPASSAACLSPISPSGYVASLQHQVICQAMVAPAPRLQLLGFFYDFRRLAGFFSERALTAFERPVSICLPLYFRQLFRSLRLINAP